MAETPARVPTQAMVLAAGVGERLGALTRFCAKPALQLGGKAVLTWIVDWLADAGVRELVVNTHHMPASLEPSLRHAEGLGLSVLRSPEEQPLGTSGGLRRALERFGDRGFGKAPFLLVNGDSLSDTDLGEFAAAHQRFGGQATLLATRTPGPGFGAEQRLKIHPDGQLGGLGFKGTPDMVVFCGVWLLEPSALELLQPETAGLGADLLAGLIRTGTGYVHVTDAGFMEIGTPERYRAARRAFGEVAAG